MEMTTPISPAYKANSADYAGQQMFVLDFWREWVGEVFSYLLVPNGNFPMGKPGPFLRESQLQQTYATQPK